MNSYEVLLIFKPILDVENVDAVINHFQKNIVEANGGEVAEVDRIGRKRLAYEIKRFKDGFLSLFLLKFPPEKVVDFRRACQLNDDILRMTMVKQDELMPRDALREEAPGRRDDRRDGGGRNFPPRRDNRDFRGGDRDQQRPPQQYQQQQQQFSGSAPNNAPQG